MEMHDELETFLSFARSVVVTPDGTCLMLWFGKEQFHVFSNPRNYKKLHDFFAARRLTLVIYKRHPDYTLSLTDLDSGDALHVRRVVFTRKLAEIFGKIPANRPIEFDILGMSADNRYVLEPPDIGVQQPMMLHGYQIV